MKRLKPVQTIFLNRYNKITIKLMQKKNQVNVPNVYT